MTEFALGQRWISNTEPELGLGLIAELEVRRITLSFPAAGERRTYATDNAPVSRVKYQEGEEIFDLDSRAYHVVSLVEEEGLITYAAQAQDTGEMVEVHEIELDCFVHFNTPEQRLFAGQIDGLKRYKLRCQTLLEQQRYLSSESLGLTGARVQPLAHQFHIASEVGSRLAPRVLLADEVGLGKTIEAGLICHRQLLSGLAQRILIVVPDALLHQWLVEMLRRFNLRFSILDEARCQALEGADLDMGFDSDDELSEPDAIPNPFESSQLVLTTLSFISSPERCAQAEEAGWDLLLVDEAHHLSWSEDQPSAEYQAIENLSCSSPGLLLLTATPEQLGIEGHFARLRLLDPDRYHNLAEFIEEEQGYQPVNELVQALMSAVDAGDAGDASVDTALLDRAGQYFDSQELTELSTADTPDALAGAVESINEKLLDRHGTGRVLFRNTRANVKGFPKRLLVRHPLALPVGEPQPESLNTLADLTEYLQPELTMPGSWLASDARVPWLLAFLKANRQEKVLLICASQETAEELELHLRLKSGVTSALFCEGMSLLERDRAAAYFADFEDGAQVLICSEIGSEGRNFQFAHQLVLFDLPSNPDLLEQRIGRLDRIGQQADIQLHVPYFEDSTQERWLAWLEQGVGIFDGPNPAASLINEHFDSSLRSALCSGELTDLLAEAQAYRVNLLAELQQGRDPLLELNSCHPERAQALVETCLAEARSEPLQDYMDLAFDVYGVDQQKHSEAAQVLHPSDHMLEAHFPGLPEDGVTVCFDRTEALSRDDIEFISWEHPMVTGTMDMVQSSDLGNTCVASVKLGPIKPGTIMVEAFFQVSAPAPKHLQLYRYLPKPLVRVFIDVNGNDLAQALDFDKLNILSQKVKRVTAQQIVKQGRDVIQALVKGAENKAQAKIDEHIQQAVESMRKSQMAEAERLLALSEVNPNIRPEEIRLIAEQTEQLEFALGKAQGNLAALKVIIAT